MHTRYNVDTWGQTSLASAPSPLGLRRRLNEYTLEWFCLKYELVVTLRGNTSISGVRIRVYN